MSLSTPSALFLFPAAASLRRELFPALRAVPLGRVIGRRAVRADDRLRGALAVLLEEGEAFRIARGSIVAEGEGFQESELIADRSAPSAPSARGRRSLNLSR